MNTGTQPRRSPRLTQRWTKFVRKLNQLKKRLNNQRHERNIMNSIPLNPFSRQNQNNPSINQESKIHDMKTKTFVPGVTALFHHAVLLVAYLFSTTVSHAEAKPARNAYVTCTAEGVRQDPGGFNFHVPPSAGAVNVSFAANRPYKLVEPKPATQQLNPPAFVYWAVECEDGEMGYPKKARGFVSMCDITREPVPVDTHEEDPCVISLTTNGKRLEQQNVRLTISIDEIKEGDQCLTYNYTRCSICGEKPEPATEHYPTQFSSDSFVWYCSEPSGDHRLSESGPRVSFNTAESLLGSFSILVSGAGSACGKQAEHASFLIKRSDVHFN